MGKMCPLLGNPMRQWVSSNYGRLDGRLSRPPYEGFHDNDGRPSKSPYEALGKFEFVTIIGDSRILAPILCSHSTNAQGVHPMLIIFQFLSGLL